MTELKPCPFCGGKAKLDHGRIGITETSYVRCEKCWSKGQSITESVRYSSDAEAIKAWNRRVGEQDERKENDIS